jgi:nucleotide-binding universal stress UspA family protein
MGTHGRTGLTRLLMGSVAEGVVRRAKCPVLTYKVPRKSPAKKMAVAAG